MAADDERTFAFVDLAGFTALTEAHGDDEAVSLLDRFERIVQGALQPPDEFVKTIGDAVMLAFLSPAAAVAAMGLLFAAAAGESGFPIPRAGLHSGSAIERTGDFFGATVNLAARVAGQAHGGQVLATAAVADVARAAGVSVVDLGEFSLRNVTEPVELFELEVCPQSAGSAIDPVCRMQVQRAEAAGRLRHADHNYWFCSLRCAGLFADRPEVYAVSDN